MSEVATIPIFADQEDTYRYYADKNDLEDYMEARINKNVCLALTVANHQFEVPDAAFELNENPSLESTNWPTQAMHDLDILHIVPPVSSGASPHQQVKQLPSLTPMAEWEGFVENIGDDEFAVVMVNVHSKSTLPTDQAVFSKDDINEHDRSLLREGAIVRWIIGRERRPSGQIRKVSELHFRRLPAHTQADYARAYHKAEALLEEIIWDDPA